MDPKKILYFPRLLAELILQLVYYTLTETETLLLTIVSCLMGYHLGIMWGVTIFFTLYLAMRMIGGWVGLLATKLHLLSKVIAENNQPRQG